MPAIWPVDISCSSLGHCFSPLSGANSRGLGAGLVHAIPFFPVEWRWHSWSFSLQLPPGGGISCKSVGQVGLMETVEGSAAPHLRSATLHNVHPFSSKVVFRFDPKVNVLIGPNGVGKSAALNRFAGVGRRRLSPASDDWEVRVDGVMGPEGASLGDVETVLRGAHQGSSDPGDGSWRLGAAQCSGTGRHPADPVEAGFLAGDGLDAPPVSCRW